MKKLLALLLCLLLTAGLSGCRMFRVMHSAGPMTFEGETYLPAYEFDFEGNFEEDAEATINGKTFRVQLDPSDKEHNFLYGVDMNVLYQRVGMELPTLEDPDKVTGLTVAWKDGRKETYQGAVLKEKLEALLACSADHLQKGDRYAAKVTFSFSGTNAVYHAEYYERQGGSTLVLPYGKKLLRARKLTSNCISPK